MSHNPRNSFARRERFWAVGFATRRWLATGAGHVPVRIGLIKPRILLGRGIVYFPPEPTLCINVTAHRESFQDWLSLAPGSFTEAGERFPRICTPSSWDVRMARRSQGAVELMLSDGAQAPAGSLIVASGHSPVARPRAVAGLGQTDA
ncbi:hypothetical protein [Paracoccus ravus]|uniref:hypothetical protein n=1 Tax=Paracoccus ravus TaxID=2447760 RepID=UPI00106E66AC|nr:hypothetical protein [Paracoccus ravus]